MVVTCENHAQEGPNPKIALLPAHIDRTGSSRRRRSKFPVCAAISCGNQTLPIMADGGEVKKRTFRKFSYRGVDLDQLLDMNTDELVDLFDARARRRCDYTSTYYWCIPSLV
jgi:hypothetical protein